MDLEEGIRGIYEGFYKMASIMKDPRYTESIADQLHCELTNGIPTSITLKHGRIVDCHDEDVRGLLRLCHKLDKEYQIKFRDLQFEQIKKDQSPS